MAGSREARLILRLVDGVSGPGRAIVGALKGVNGAVRGMTSVGLAPAKALSASARNLRTAANNLAPTGAAISIGINKAMKDVYNLEKQLNISQAAGGLDLAKRNEFMEEAVRLNGLYAATSAEIVAGGNELLKSGLNYDQMKGSLPGVLNTAQAMDVPISEASAAIVTAMTALRMDMSSTDAAMASSVKMADLYAHALNETAGAELIDFRTSGKYFNSVAAAIGMATEEATAWQIAMAKGGLYGSGAGTGLRAAPGSIANPSEKGREAFDRLGIDFTKYTKKKGGSANGSQIVGALESAGILGDGAIEGLEDSIDAMIKSGRFKGAPKKLAGAIMSQFNEELGAATTEDKALIASTLQRAITAGASEVDMLGVLKELKAKGAGIGDFKDIFGGNHFSKLMAIDPDGFEKILSDVYKLSPGTAKKMREQMMLGIVGDVNEFGAAWEKMAVAIGKAGLLNDAARAITTMSKALSSLADSNPTLIRFGSYAALALAALAPLGFALSGAAAALAVMVNPLALVVGSLGILAALNVGPIISFMKTFANSFAFNLNPKIANGLRSIKDALSEMFSLRLTDNTSFRETARSWGAAAADLANRLVTSGPQIRAFMDTMKEMGAGALAAAMPQLQKTFDSLSASMRPFLDGKWDAVGAVGDALASFIEKAKPFFDPMIASAASMISASFDTLGIAFGALTRISTDTTTGIVAFLQSFVNTVDPETIRSFSATISGAFDLLAAAGRLMGQAFALVDLSALKGIGTTLGELAGMGLNGYVATLRGVIESVIQVFGMMTGKAPDFSSAQAAFKMMADAIDGVASRVEAAVQRIVKAITGVNIPGWASNNAMVGTAAAGTINANPLVPNMTVQPRAAGVGEVDGKRASGGPIRRGMTYLTGERGPEVVTMGSNGYVTPNSKVGGGHVYNITVNAPGAQRGAGEEIASALERRLKRSEQIALDGRLG